MAQILAPGLKALRVNHHLLMAARDAEGRAARATMEYYVGMDVSLKETSICVVNGSGEIVSEVLLLATIPEQCPVGGSACG